MKSISDTIASEPDGFPEDTAETRDALYRKEEKPMNAKDILARRFEKATFNGYKTDDVDEFLREISSEYAQLQKEKNELERKLEVLADKIRADEAEDPLEEDLEESDDEE